MADPFRSSPIDRRAFALGAWAAGAFALGPGGSPTQAQDRTGPALPPAGPEQWKEVITVLTGGATPKEGRITLEVPDPAENGNMVPFSVAVDSPMTDSDHVTAVHIVSTGNPRPEIASLFFTPLSGKAAAASRMRLARTQDVYVIAQMSTGQVYALKRTIKVTIGGCGT